MWTQIKLQEQSDMDLQFVKEASKTFQQMTKTDNIFVIVALRKVSLL